MRRALYSLPPRFAHVLKGHVIAESKRAVVYKHDGMVYKFSRVENTKLGRIVDQTELRCTLKVSKLGISPPLLSKPELINVNGMLMRIYIHKCCHDLSWRMLEKKENIEKVSVYVSRALNTLRNNNLLYLDLKKENVVNCGGRCKLIDFEHAYCTDSVNMSKLSWDLIIVIQKLLFSLGCYDVIRSSYMMFKIDICRALVDKPTRKYLMQIMAGQSSLDIPQIVLKKLKLLFKTYCSKTIGSCMNWSQFENALFKLYQC